MLEAIENVLTGEVLTRNDSTCAWMYHTSKGAYPLTSSEAWHILQQGPQRTRDGQPVWRGCFLPSLTEAEKCS